MLLRAYQRQIELQCVVALQAAEVFDSRQAERLWPSIQNLLNAVANISKACWGSGGKRVAQRASLRKSLEIDDSSPIRWTTVRNHWEHYDERMDEWWDTSPDHTFIDMNVMPRSVVVVKGQPAAAARRPAGRSGPLAEYFLGCSTW